MNNSKLQIGIIGAGAISEFHLQAWRQCSEANVVAITDVNQENAKAKADAFGIPAIYERVEDMLKNEHLDAVDIITPVETHAFLTKLCVNEGIDVICQKPLTPTAKLAEELCNYCDGKARVMVHENTRFKPHFQKAKQILESGELGRIKRVNLTVRSSGYFRKDSDALPFYLMRQPYLSEFVLLLIFESLIHHIDVLASLFGKLSVIYSSATNLNTTDLSGEDTALILFSSEDNTLISLDGSFAAAGSPSLPEDKLEIMGEEGRAVITNHHVTLSKRDTDRTEKIENEYSIPFHLATQHFVDCLISGKEFETSAHSNLETLRLVESVYEKLVHFK
ncbi:Gfo/Idh/MocA family oxidoreductase [Vibrio sp. S9_S30]|uniref:Gfo/Idh/MocA family protein n=1 Tax=Vibrio sp. S9_S30 TaxID=2720226 RepID=UPI00168091E6|nr:Gfo/Idh/MocA family oxidoreductase [Vibrio sp. S9_S30]MBD1557802.1 Gfo/Idh/MocA family oxidoreductase [Vibrio sp. S9_S30]